MIVAAHGHPLMALMLGGNPETTDDQECLWEALSKGIPEGGSLSLNPSGLTCSPSDAESTIWLAKDEFKHIF